MQHSRNIRLVLIIIFTLILQKSFSQTFEDLNLGVNPLAGDYNKGVHFYNRFIEGYKINKNKEKLKKDAIKSMQYFETIYDAGGILKEISLFPLIQLANFLEIEEKKKEYEECNIQTYQYPISTFTYLPADWKTNYSTDVISWYSKSDSGKEYRGVEYAVSNIIGYSFRLKVFDEPTLNEIPSKKVFRIFWLQALSTTKIVFRIENYNDTVTLYWKVLKSGPTSIRDIIDGYDKREIIEENSKILTLKDWTDILDKVNEIDFWNLTSVNTEGIEPDGTTWILEGKELEKNHIVERWGGGEIAQIAGKLLRLSEPENQMGKSYQKERNYQKEKKRIGLFKNIKIEEVEIGHSYELNILFKKRDYRLLPSSKIELERLVLFLKENPTIEIRLEGHTESLATPDRNQKLSEYRVRMLKKYLEMNGISTHRIEWKGYGGSRAKEGQNNNRIDIVITKK